MAEQSVLYKRLLGKRLSQLRDGTALSLEDSADKLGRTSRTIRRFEDGDTLPDKLQLEALCGLYQADEQVRQELENLREFARQPVWWSYLGPRPPATSAWLSMELLAYRMRDYDHAAIPGLLQTTAYAMANIQAVEESISPQKVRDDVELRMERQTMIWDSPRPPEATFLIDEAALHRMSGPGEARRAQLARLLVPPESATILVVPFHAGPHPSLGTYRIFDLDLSSVANGGARGVFVEGSAAQQGVVLEADSDIAQFELAFERTKSKALSEKDSARLIKERMKGTRDD